VFNTIRFVRIPDYHQKVTNMQCGIVKFALCDKNRQYQPV